MKEPFLWDRALGLNYGFKPKVTACEFNIFFFFFLRSCRIYHSTSFRVRGRIESIESERSSTRSVRPHAVRRVHTDLPV